MATNFLDVEVSNLSAGSAGKAMITGTIENTAGEVGVTITPASFTGDAANIGLYEGIFCMGDTSAVTGSITRPIKNEITLTYAAGENVEFTIFGRVTS